MESKDAQRPPPAAPVDPGDVPQTRLRASSSPEGDGDDAPSPESGPGAAEELQRMLAAGAKEASPEFSKLSLRGKWRYIRVNMTVEPVVALHLTSIVFASMAMQNLVLEKACRVNLGLDASVCDALMERNTANYTLEEQQVQQITASIAGWQSLIQSAPSTAFILLAGSWSDRHARRKPFILLSVVGQFLTAVLYIVCAVWEDLRMEFLLLADMPSCLLGGMPTMFMAANSYLADTTTVEARTVRIGVMNVLVSMGIPVGTALSGVSYQQVGCEVVLAISASIFVLVFCYAFKYIRETPAEEKKSHGLLGTLKDFFQVRCLADTFRVCFKKRENNQRAGVLLILLLVVVLNGPNNGEGVVLYLFTRLRFNWDEVSYSAYLTASALITMIGSSFSVGVLSHRLKLDDSVLGMVAFATRMLSALTFAFASSAWMMYAGSLLELIIASTWIGMRSILSKLVPSNELGQVNSVFGAIQGIMPFAFGPLYSAIYQLTLDTFPGAFYLVSAAFTPPGFLIFAFVYRISLQQRKTKEEELPMKPPAGDT